MPITLINEVQLYNANEDVLRRPMYTMPKIENLSIKSVSHQRQITLAQNILLTFAKLTLIGNVTFNTLMLQSQKRHVYQRSMTETINFRQIIAFCECVLNILEHSNWRRKKFVNLQRTPDSHSSQTQKKNYTKQ